jgi:cell division protease FtsH
VLQRAAASRLLVSLVGVLVASCVTLVVLVIVSAPAASGNELPLSTLQALVSSGRVESAVIHDVDRRVTGQYLQSPKGTAVDYWAAFPASDAEVPALVDRLTADGATVSVDEQGAKSALLFLARYALPAIIVVDLAAIAVVARTRRRTSRRGHRRWSFADVAGQEDAIATLKQVAAPLLAPRHAIAGDAPTRVLIHGPTGCGKRLLARATAGEVGAELLELSARELLAGSSNDIIGAAKDAAPAVMYVSDLDSAHDDRCFAQLKQVLRDAASLSSGDRVALIAACSDLGRVPQQLIRAAQIQRVVGVEPPVLQERMAILTLHSRSHALAEDVDLAALAQRTAGLTGADLQALLNDAAIRARLDNRPSLTAADIDAALQHLVQSPSCHGRVLSGDERRRAAVHEAGHAVVAAALGRGRSVQRLSVLIHGRGITRLLEPLDHRENMSRSDVLAELTVLCGGTAAEELYFDEPSTSGVDDVRAATYMARAMAGRYGMSPNMGRVNVIDAAAGSGTTVATGAENLTELDREIRRLIRDATEAATERLQRCHDPLVDLVLQLERDEVVEGLQLSGMLIRTLEVEIAGISEKPAAEVTVPGARQRTRARGSTIER